MPTAPISHRVAPPSHHQYHHPYHVQGHARADVTPLYLFLGLVLMHRNHNRTSPVRYTMYDTIPRRSQSPQVHKQILHSSNAAQNGQAEVSALVAVSVAVADDVAVDISAAIAAALATAGDGSAVRIFQQALPVRLVRHQLHTRVHGRSVQFVVALQHVRTPVQEAREGLVVCSGGCCCCFGTEVEVGFKVAGERRGSVKKERDYNTLPLEARRERCEERVERTRIRK